MPSELSTTLTQLVTEGRSSAGLAELVALAVPAEGNPGWDFPCVPGHICNYGNLPGFLVVLAASPTVAEERMADELQRRDGSIDERTQKQAALVSRAVWINEASTAAQLKKLGRTRIDGIAEAVSHRVDIASLADDDSFVSGLKPNGGLALRTEFSETCGLEIWAEEFMLRLHWNDPAFDERMGSELARFVVGTVRSGAGNVVQKRAAISRVNKAFAAALGADPPRVLEGGASNGANADEFELCEASLATRSFQTTPASWATEPFCARQNRLLSAGPIFSNPATSIALFGDLAADVTGHPSGNEVLDDAERTAYHQLVEDFRQGSVLNNTDDSRAVSSFASSLRRVSAAMFNFCGAYNMHLDTATTGQ